MPERSIAGQLGAYAAFAAVLVAFSASPTYQHLGPGDALVRLSMGISGDIVGECRTVTAPELARLPPNMRATEVCPRERADVHVRVQVDGRTAVEETLGPRGIARDGAAFIYRRIHVPAGEHRISVRVATDTGRPDAAHEHQHQVRLAAGEMLTIDYDRGRGGVVFR